MPSEYRGHQRVLTFLVLLLVMTASTSACQHHQTNEFRQGDQETAQAPAIAQELVSRQDENGWPKTIQVGERRFILFQPQVTEWSKGRTEQKLAMQVHTPESSKPGFGVISLSADTKVDPETKAVTFEKIRIRKIEYPVSPKSEESLRNELQAKIADVLGPVTSDQLQANAETTKIQSRRAVPELKNDPPMIIHSASPSLLVLIDGEPVLRESGAPGLFRVVNTRALLVFNKPDKNYYLFIGDRWLTARKLSDPWRSPQQTPDSLTRSLEQAKQAAVTKNQVDLLDSEALLKALQSGSQPRVYVRTKPAELIETVGTPAFQPIAGTPLLDVSNTSRYLFMNTNDQKFYLLLSGRWYRSSAIDKDWEYVPPTELPREFANIPDNHSKSAALASVPGTAQAKEAVISNSVPQTATVDRQTATAEITYDGQPEFIPIAGTALKYARNSPTAVIQAEDGAYYAVQNGIWLVGKNPTGPWTLATSVPTGIYSIPPSSPVYHVTYVYIYGASPRFVHYGYLPGYLGSYITPTGTVVYGTGYIYDPWVRDYWYGSPITFGMGLTWGYGYNWSFTVGYSFGYYGGSPFYPWWGPWWGHLPHRHEHTVPVVQYNVVVHEVNFGHTNFYRNLEPGKVRSNWRNARSASGLVATPEQSRVLLGNPSRDSLLQPETQVPVPTRIISRPSDDRGWGGGLNSGFESRSPSVSPPDTPPASPPMIPSPVTRPDDGRGFGRSSRP